MKKSDEKLLLKKQTLTAWANILLAKGMIDLAKCNRMKSLIEKLTAKSEKTAAQCGLYIYAEKFW